jgi:hypothetical protein
MQHGRLSLRGGYMCLAPKARHSILSLGQRPRVRGIPNPPALKARFLQVLRWAEGESRFQRLFTSWGDAPGCK